MEVLKQRHVLSLGVIIIEAVSKKTERIPYNILTVSLVDAFPSLRSTHWG